jgi:hypothetical protein
MSCACSCMWLESCAADCRHGVASFPLSTLALAITACCLQVLPVVTGFCAVLRVLRLLQVCLLLRSARCC